MHGLGCVGGDGRIRIGGVGGAPILVRLPSAAEEAPMPEPTSPNVVFFHVDNLGFGELGCYGGGMLHGAHTRASSAANGSRHQYGRTADTADTDSVPPPRAEVNASASPSR